MHLPDCSIQRDHVDIEISSKLLWQPLNRCQPAADPILQGGYETKTILSGRCSMACYTDEWAVRKGRFCSSKHKYRRIGTWNSICLGQDHVEQGGDLEATSLAPSHQQLSIDAIHQIHRWWIVNADTGLTQIWNERQWEGFKEPTVTIMSRESENEHSSWVPLISS